MKLDWRIDRDARAICWEELLDAPVDMLKGSQFSTVLDLGSSNGAFGRLISGNRPARIIGVDMSRGEAPAEHVEFVQADILHLPFKDESFDLVSARAILHHVPGDVEAAIQEASRVLQEGHFFVCQEPTSDNLVSELARRVLQTVLHDPSEKTFSSATLELSIARRLSMRERRHHLVFTYLLPHIISRLRGLSRRLILGLSVLLTSADRRLLGKGRFWQRRAAYVTFLAEKSPAKK